MWHGGAKTATGALTEIAETNFNDRLEVALDVASEKTTALTKTPLVEPYQANREHARTRDAQTLTNV